MKLNRSPRPSLVHRPPPSSCTDHLHGTVSAPPCAVCSCINFGFDFLHETSPFPVYTVEPLLKDTPEMRTPPQLIRTLDQVPTSYKYVFEDTFPIRTHFIGPRVSVFTRFHCSHIYMYMHMHMRVLACEHTIQGYISSGAHEPPKAAKERPTA